KTGDAAAAADFLNRAIDAYIRGFEADPRDAYPGINAVTLLDIEGSELADKRKAEILPVVRFAVNQRLKRAAPDYWDYATLLELAVLASNQADAARRLSEAVANVRETWEPERTGNNRQLIR